MAEKTLLSVKFGGVTEAGKAVNIPFKFARRDLPIGKREKLFINALLCGKLMVDPAGQNDIPGQKKLRGDDVLVENFIGHVMSYSANRNNVGCTLVIEHENGTKNPGFKELGRFAKLNGQIEIEKTGTARTGESNPDDDSDSE